MFHRSERGREKETWFPKRDRQREKEIQRERNSFIERERAHRLFVYPISTEQGRDGARVNTQRPEGSHQRLVSCLYLLPEVNRHSNKSSGDF